ncbi:hypothetical protein THRCLA_20384 [Thraustotheca clavata]|uniref:Uncharacterized protein n=1 Tax=Thraustotheca clavata TaxID=74557 RepID=A0A1W0A7Z0_9STRA|nr:hypothetical protein THRCLA_20384 [Thraustotheca clavata]
MGQGASLAKSIINDTRELIQMTNKQTYQAQYKAYLEATAKLEAAKKQNATLTQNLEKTKQQVYAQSEAFKQQKLVMDKQIDEFVKMHSLGAEVQAHQEALKKPKDT